MRINDKKIRVSFKELKHNIPLLFILVVFSSFSFAQTPTLGFKTSIDWLSIAYLVLVIVAGLLGIAFMISRIFAMPQLEAWTKEEFVNLLLSVAILVLFTAFVGIVESISSSLASDILSSAATDTQLQYWSYKPNEGRWNLISTSNPSCPYPCHIYLARGFLGSLYEVYGSSLKSIAEYYFYSVFYSTVSIGTGFDVTWGKFKFEMGFGYPLHAGLIIFNNILQTVVSEYLKVVTAIKMQEIALVYLTSLGGIFFIIGLISRSVWFLRKFGGLLLAAGIGLYFIFPMVYVLSWYTIDRSTISFTLYLPEVTPSFNPFQVSNVEGLGDINILFTDFNTGQIGMLDALGRSYLVVTVVPILAVFTTLGFIRHFSPMIGGDVEIAGLTRII